MHTDSRRRWLTRFVTMLTLVLALLHRQSEVFSFGVSCSCLYGGVLIEKVVHNLEPLVNDALFWQHAVWKHQLGHFDPCVVQHFFVVRFLAAPSQMLHIIVFKVFYASLH